MYNTEDGGRLIYLALPLTIVGVAGMHSGFGSSCQRRICFGLTALFGVVHGLSAQPADLGTASTRSSLSSATLFGVAINTRTKEPVAGAIVILSSPDYKTLSDTVKTDDRGTFVIHDVAAGKYRIACVKQGFSLREYGAPRPLMPGDIFVVNGAGEKGPLTIEMTPSSRVSGRIVDLEKTPLAKLRVELMQFKEFRDEWRLIVVGSRETGSDGTYSFDSIPPGRYYIHTISRALVSARPKRSDARCTVGPKVYGAVYYPGVDTPDSASALIVEEGMPTLVSDLVMELRDSTCAVGRIVFPRGGAEDVRISVLEPDSIVQNTESITETVTIHPSDDFEISAIPAGPYLISLLPQSSATIYQMHQVFLAPTETEMFTLTLADKGRADLSLAGERSDDEDSKIDFSQLVVQFRSRRVIDKVFETHIDAGGHGTQQSLPEDSFTVHLDGLPEHAYLKALQVNGQLLPDTNEAFSPSTEGPTSILLTLSNTAGSLDGLVVGGAPRRQLNATVILMATQGGQDLPVTIKLAAADAAGHFTIGGIPPGDYSVLALGDLEWGSAYDPEVLSRYHSYASHISVAARSGQRITLHLVGASPGPQ